MPSWVLQWMLLYEICITFLYKSEIIKFSNTNYQLIFIKTMGRAGNTLNFVLRN